MKLTDLWKEKSISVLKSIYGNMINYDKLNEYLDGIINESLKKKRIMMIRNIYKKEIINLEMNDVLDWCLDNGYIIGANGCYSEDPNKLLGDTSMMLIRDLDGRAKEKSIAKEYEKKNMLKDASLHDNLQTKLKQDINSTYGIACMPGSFLFNPDAASYITAQSRQLISEVMWSFERLLANNMEFDSYDEALLYYNNIINEKKNFDKFVNYIDYIPTKEELYKFALKRLAGINNFYETSMKMSNSLFLFFNNLSDIDRVYLYYKNNLFDLLFKNKNILKILIRMMNNKEDFLNPNDIPDSYINDLTELISVIKEFCYTNVTTFNRVDKYFNKKREISIISDTDSVFTVLSDYKKSVYKVSKIEINQNNDFKIINILCAILTDFMEYRHEIFVERCNVKYKFDNYKLNAKNEFYMKRMIIYVGVKKNYSCLKLLREGNILPPKRQISHTGIKLISSKIPEQVMKFQDKIIEEKILRSDIINPVEILKDIKEEEKYIMEAIKNGDKSFGVPERFSGWGKYKNPASIQICRLVEIWNRLYPENKVSSGEYMMVFSTVITDKSKLYLIKDIDMRKNIEEKIYSYKYNGELNYLVSKGISVIGIPRDGDMFKIPEWMRDIIDYKVMAEKHLQSIVDMLPSLNMKKSRITGSDTRYSSLISIT